MWPQVIQTVSVVIAAATFVYGVGSWRRNVLGQKRIDLAVQGIIAFREVEVVFREIRSPVSHGDEGRTRARRPGESEQDAQLAQQAYVAIERINNRSEEFSKIQGLKYQFEAYFGQQVRKPFDDVEVVRQEIFGAAVRLEYLWKRQGKPFDNEEERQTHLRAMQTAEAIFWEGTSNPDPFTSRILEIIEEMNEICSQTIEPSPNICVLWQRSMRKFKRFWLCR